MPRSRSALAILVALLVLGAAGAAVASSWAPGIPPKAGSDVLVRTDVEGVPAPDPDPNVDPSTVASDVAGSACLERIERSTGWLDLCWSVWREVRESDQDKDYYVLRVFGTLGAHGTGVRWWTVRSDLVGEPAANVLAGWPDGTIEGDCVALPVDLPLNDAGSPEFICGRTSGTVDSLTSTQVVSWTCVGCLFADRSDRGVVSYAWVGVDEGEIPAWDIGADFGD